jgi:toxin-antitoxin system PIN domain toxin
VILIDTNILIEAGLLRAKSHVQARTWLDEQFSNGVRVGLPWHSILGFVRLATNRNAFHTGLSISDAWQIARDWLNAPTAWIPQPSARHADVIDDLIASANVGTKDVMDLHLAALAIEHGLTLCSADTGFVRFKKLRWMNPLAP